MPRKALALAVTLLAAAGYAGSATAQAPMLCSKPIQPLCSTGVQQFADDSERQRCLSDTDGYLEELEAYRACLQTAAEEAQQVRDQAQGFRRCLEDGREDCGLDSDNSL